jgi:hypothetical protein
MIQENKASVKAGFLILKVCDSDAHDLPTLSTASQVPLPIF